MASADTLPAEVQHDEPSQTINTPNNLATATTISTHDSDANKNANEASTLESQNSLHPEIKPTSKIETSTTQILDSDNNKQSTSTIHDLDANTQSAITSTEDLGNPSQPVEHSTSEIPDSDASKITTHDSPKSSTTMVLTSNQDSNFVDQTKPPTANNDTKQTTDQSTQTTSQTPDSDASKLDNTNTSNDLPKSPTTKVLTSEQDSNSVDQSNPPTADSDTKQTENQSTQNTSQTPDSDANKQDNTTTHNELPKSSTTKVLTSNQDSNSVNETNPPTANSDTKQTKNQSTQTTSQTPSSDASKQDNTTSLNDLPKSSTTKVLTSNQDSNSVDQSDPPAANSDTKQTTNQSTQTTSQTPDSDASKQDNTTAPNDLPKDSTTKVLTSNQDSNSVDQSDPPAVNSDTKQTTNQSTQTTSKTPDSDANKQDNTTAPNELPKSSTTEVLTSNQDSNSVNETNPPTTNSDSKETTNQSTQTTTPTPDSDAGKQDNTTTPNDLPKSSTVSTSNQDSNSVDQSNPPTANSDTKQATNQSTQTTSQASDLDANKQANTITTDPQESSTPMDPTPNQDSKSIGEINASKDESDTKQAPDESIETTSIAKDSPQSDKPNEERKHLDTLIRQELEFVQNICPRLGKHEKHIREAAENAEKVYKTLTKDCELKELKDLKKTVTKLKLQIPAKYRTYDESDKQKKHQSDVENKAISKLLKKLPRLHDKLFHGSPFCKAIQLSFNNLPPHLKLCLLCFSVFPENTIISRRTMVYWWIGEGLTPCEDDLEGGSTAEDSANEYFQKLIELEFIEPVSSSYRRYVAFCKVHPMVRAALVMIADKINFFDFDKYGDPKDFGKFDEIGSPEDLPRFYPLGDPREFFDFFDEKQVRIEGPIQISDPSGNPYQFAAMNQESSELLDRDGKAINITKKFYLYTRKKIITKSYQLCLMGSGLSKGITWEKLHMLFNVGDIVLEFKPEWFLRMKNINVLFLGRWKSSAAHHIEVDEFELEKCLDNMNHVTFFSLQGVSRISKLPDSISNLKSLLILDLRACHNLEVIPKTIGSLKCLTHLDISECYLLNKIPKEICYLESLQVLKGFVVVESPGRDECTLKDLIKLGNLRKLNMYTHMKEFPQESHLEDLQNLETLRKLTILWGGHESKTLKTNGSNLEDVKKKKQSLASKVMKLIPKKKRVQGAMRRMNAFSNSTLGARLEKLDLKCFPQADEAPEWLKPGNLKGLKKLYIRGGRFSDLGQYQDNFQWDDHSPVLPIETWDVEILRLKYLEEVKMEWGELKSLFPKLISLEKVKCPRLTLFPCNEHGVWIGSVPSDDKKIVMN